MASIILFATLVGFKVYFGIFAAIGTCLVILVEMLKTFSHFSKGSFLKRVQLTLKTHFIHILFVALFAIISAFIYFPVNKASGGLFYAPLAWPKLFLGSDALDFRLWWLRQQVYEANHNVPGMLLLTATAIFICLVSVYGTRLLGFFCWQRIAKHISLQLYVFFFPAIILFTLFGLFTLQTSGLFNVFNFFAVATVGLGLFSAIICHELWQSKKILSRIALGLLVIVTLPRSLNEIYLILNKYATNHYDYIFSFQEIEALQAIKNKTPQNTVIQSSLYNENDRYTPYVSFFSDRSTYLSGDRLLETHNQPFENRKAGLIFIFDAADSYEFAQRVTQRKIDILYLVKRSNHTEDLHFPISSSYWYTLFENDGALVIARKDQPSIDVHK